MEHMKIQKISNFENWIDSFFSDFYAVKENCLPKLQQVIFFDGKINLNDLNKIIEKELGKPIRSKSRNITENVKEVELFWKVPNREVVINGINFVGEIILDFMINEPDEVNGTLFAFLLVPF